MLLVLDVLRDPPTPAPFNLPLDLYKIAVNLKRRLAGGPYVGTASRRTQVRV
jgi:hypothetical protein